MGAPAPYIRRKREYDAGWSSPVARQAHNLKVLGSNPSPATNYGDKRGKTSKLCFEVFS